MDIGITDHVSQKIQILRKIILVYASIIVSNGKVNYIVVSYYALLEIVEKHFAQYDL